MSTNPSLIHTTENNIRNITAASLLTVFGIFSLPAAADNLNKPATAPYKATAPKNGLSLQFSYNSKYRRTALAYETPELWTHQFQNGWGSIDLTVELGLAYWKAMKKGPSSMGQISAIPILRWWPKQNFYVELGSGPTMLSRSKFGNLNLGTRFQFGSHFGAGFMIKDAHHLGIRYSHYSNASIKKPNPGLDLVGVVYTYKF